MPERRALDVLLIACACSPLKRGEHLLGWEWATRLARRHRVTVLTREAHLPDTEGRRPATLTVLPVPDGAFRFLRRLGWPGLAAYYWTWQSAAARLGRRLLTEGRFDVVHQCTFHSCRIPGRLAAPGHPPFIWGPVAGLEQVPFRMLPATGAGAFREVARRAANWLAPRIPSVRRTLRRAHTVLVSNSDTLDRLAGTHARRYVLLPANAVDPSDLPAWEPAAGPLHLLAVGSLVRIRAFNLVLRALAGLDATARARVLLTFIGDGPDAKRLQTQVRALGLDGRVRFAGSLSRAETLSRMSGAHALVFPSLRDSGGSAVAEAMSMGLPVIALRLAGPGSMLAEGGGFLIEARSPAQVVRDLRALIERLIQEPDLLKPAGERGRAVARAAFEWDGRVERIEGIYRRAAGLAERAATVNG